MIRFCEIRVRKSQGKMHLQSNSKVFQCLCEQQELQEGMGSKHPFGAVFALCSVVTEGFASLIQSFGFSKSA